MYRILYVKDTPGQRYVPSTQLVEWGERACPYRRNELTRTHVEIAALDGVGMSLDEIYEAMQGEVWSPNGEAKDIIADAGVGHTSMSVGDVIYNDRTREAWEVISYGFRAME